MKKNILSKKNSTYPETHKTVRLAKITKEKWFFGGYKFGRFE